MHLKSFLFVVFFIAFCSLQAQIKSLRVTNRSDIDNKKHISYTKEFDKSGNLIKYLDYDSDGKLETETKYDYNGNTLVKKVERNLDFKSEETTLILTDKTLKTVTTKVLDNNKLRYALEVTQDKNDSIIQSKYTVNNTEMLANYKYIKVSNNVLKKEQTLDGKTSVYKTFTYDNNQRIIELLIHDTYVIRKTKFEYQNNVIYKVTDSDITRNGTEVIQHEVTYDIYKNPIYEKIYNKNKLITEHRMTYEFDKINNWIKKIVETKDYIFTRKPSFKPNYTETRKIKYW